MLLLEVHGEHASVRLVDSSGSLSSTGLLEVSLGGAGSISFGTVCGLNAAAADVVCKQLGYDFGSASPSPCSRQGGSSSCGAPGSPVAMKSLRCQGSEISVDECEYEGADDSCLSHAGDAIVYCGLVGVGAFTDGAARLIDESGAPALNLGSSATGRLEIFLASVGAWAPVCKSGFTSGAAASACKEMGFSGQSGFTSCDSSGLCGTVPPHIGDLACGGSEENVLDCAHTAGEDVFCAPEESIVVTCSGHGDASGRPARGPAPKVIA